MKTPKESYQAQKGSDFSVSLGQSKFSYSFQLLFAGPDALFGHMMGQIVDLILEEFALTQLEFRIMLSKAQCAIVASVPPWFWKDNHIIQVN